MVATVKALKPEPEMHYTSYPGHATLIAEQLAREGADWVVAAGGDGTVNEVLQGLCKVNATRADVLSHTALGTLPAGTMNVFAYEIGFLSHRKLSRPWRIMSGGARRRSICGWPMTSISCNSRGWGWTRKWSPHDVGHEEALWSAELCDVWHSRAEQAPAAPHGACAGTA